jgi:hypothetical protein
VWDGDSGSPAYASNKATFTSGYASGSTSVTLGSVSTGSISNLRVGSLLTLGQADYASDNGNVWVCSSSGANGNCSQQGATNVYNGYTLGQTVTVTSISGSGPWTVGISPGIYLPNLWASSQNPFATWSSSVVPVSGVGIENLSLDYSGASGNDFGVMIHHGLNDWISGVRSKNTVGANATLTHIELYQSQHLTVQNTYMYGSNDAAEGYGIDCNAFVSDTLIQNNITQHIATGYMAEGCSASVFGYNYSVDNFFGGNWQQGDAFHHGGGDYYVLWEGHEGIQYASDDIHGTGYFITGFRDYWSGLDPATIPEGAKSQNTSAYTLFAYARYHNLIGSVVGTSGFHNAYTEVPSSTTDCGNSTATTVMILGFSEQPGTNFSNKCNGQPFTIYNDSLVASTLLRWGNYDTVTAAVRWCGNSSNLGWSTTCGSASEVPTGDAHYPNSVPSSTTLPASFYLSTKPGFWGSMPWPSVGPDVTGGNIAKVGGYAYHNPAANCYLNIMGGKTDGSSGALTFNANTCYTITQSGTAPPLGVTAIVH